jgi:hypothetical protein
LVYVYYNLKLWVKQLEKKPDAKAISLDGIDTTTTWRVEVEEPVIETSLDWLEDSDDDHGISEELDRDVPEDIQFHVESTSVPPQSHSHSQREIDPVVALAVYLLYLLLGDIGLESSSSSRGRSTPVRGAHASRAPTPSARGKALSATITFARKRGRAKGNR